MENNIRNSYIMAAKVFGVFILGATLISAPVLGLCAIAVLLLFWAFKTSREDLPELGGKNDEAE